MSNPVSDHSYIMELPVSADEIRSLRGAYNHSEGSEEDVSTLFTERCFRTIEGLRRYNDQLAGNNALEHGASDALEDMLAESDAALDYERTRNDLLSRLIDETEEDLINTAAALRGAETQVGELKTALEDASAETETIREAALAQLLHTLDVCGEMFGFTRQIRRMITEVKQLLSHRCCGHVTDALGILEEIA